jgi:hypothetical protein
MDFDLSLIEDGDRVMLAAQRSSTLIDTLRRDAHVAHIWRYTRESKPHSFPLFSLIPQLPRIVIVMLLSNLIASLSASLSSNILSNNQAQTSSPSASKYEPHFSAKGCPKKSPPIALQSIWHLGTRYNNTRKQSR